MIWNIQRSVFLLLFPLILMGIAIIMAAPLRNVPQLLVQPNGDTLRCFASGDEYYNWLHDKDNYTIIQDNRTGYYTYAVLQNSELVSSKYVVGTVNPKEIGLTRGINISPQGMSQQHRAMLEKAVAAVTMPHTGTAANIVVFVRFSDESEFTDPIAWYDSMFNAGGSGPSSVRRYFPEVSYGKLNVFSTLYPIPSGSTVSSYQDSHSRSYFEPYDSITNPNGYKGGKDGSERNSRERSLVASAINAINFQVPVSLNVDNDNDGFVDNVCLVVDGNPIFASLLWPHMRRLDSVAVYINAKQVGTYNIQLQGNIGVGTLCHEMFHSLGAPDMYHYSYDGLVPLYSWDIMDHDLNPPQHMGAYMKMRYGTWIDSIPQIRTNGTYTLNPLTSSVNNCYMIVSPNSSTEYFVLEYRKHDGKFESSLPGEGLLVYRINTIRDGLGNAQGPPDEAYVYRPDGTPSRDGTPRFANFSSDEGRTEITDETNPYSFLSNGNPGGLDISSIGSVGNTISFNVTLQSPSGTTYVITAAAGAHGSISPNGTIIVSQGANREFKIIPDLGYRVDSIIVGGVKVDSTASYTFTNVTTNNTIRATFAVDPTQRYGHLSVRDDFNAPAVSTLNGRYKWVTLTNNESVSASIQINSDSTISPYNTGGVGSYGGVAWDSLFTDNTQIGLVIKQKGGNGSSSSFLIYFRMSGKDLSTSNGYRLRYIDNPSGTDQIDIMRMSNGTSGTTIATLFSEIFVNDTLVARVGADKRMTVFVFGANRVRDTLSVIDNVYNPSSWYCWIRGCVFSTPVKLDNFMIGKADSISTYTITSSAGANGDISPKPSVAVNYGGSQTFTITPSTGYHVDSLIVDGVKVDSTTSYTFHNVTAGHTIRATFAIDQFTIYSSAGSNGDISPKPSATVNYGISQAFTITPSTGYHVDSLIVDGVKVDSTTSYTFHNVTANHTIRVTFAIDQFTIYSSAGANGDISPKPSATVNYNGSQTFTITPATGYHVDSLIVDGVKEPSASSYEFTNVTASHTIRVTFAIDQFTITSSATGPGSISPTPSATVNYGGSQKFTMTPISGALVDSVLVDGIEVDSLMSYTFMNVTANHTIQAIFGYSTQTISLRSGWGIISSYIEPLHTQLDSIFKSVRSDVIILKNGTGKTFIPSVPVNTIGPWVKTQGYQIKMTGSLVTNMSGLKIIPESTSISVPTGWSITAYFRDSEMSIVTALSSIVGDIIVVKDQDGKTYIPSVPVNTIGNMKPGQGYQIKMSNTRSFTYPANGTIPPEPKPSKDNTQNTKTKQGVSPVPP